MLHRHIALRWQLISLVLAFLLFVVAVGVVQASEKAVNNLVATNTSPNVLTLTWEEPEAASKDYRVRFVHVETSTTKNKFPSSNSLVLTGLDTGDYSVRVRARYDGESNGGWSAKKTVTVKDGAIKNLSAESLAPGTVSVSWDVADPVPDDYRVVFAKVGEKSPKWTDKTANRFPTSNSVELTGLEEGETYKVNVRARYDGAKNGKWTKTTVTVAHTPEEEDSEAREDHSYAFMSFIVCFPLENEACSRGRDVYFDLSISPDSDDESATYVVRIDMLTSAGEAADSCEGDKMGSDQTLTGAGKVAHTGQMAGGCAAGTYSVEYRVKLQGESNWRKSTLPLVLE